PTRADLGLQVLDLGATADRFANVELAGEVAAPAPFGSAPAFGDVEHSPALGASKPAPAPVSVYEQSRSAVWPLVLALGVGAALGFAGGYAMGIYDRPVAISAAARATAPAGREFTEGTVSQAAKTATAQPQVSR
ncbi:MAG: hypothetical protein AAB295_06870, partial [Chloroflexota bacterium]